MFEDEVMLQYIMYSQKRVLIPSIVGIPLLIGLHIATGVRHISRIRDDLINHHLLIFDLIYSLYFAPIFTNRAFAIA